ncbi:hypothetical protein ETC03_06395 [Geobacillus sp. MMMUD3]|nr:hypothetical protein [Geobacillus sp. MMMUD3]
MERDIGKVLLSLRFLVHQRIPYLFSFGLAKCFTQNFIHHRQMLDKKCYTSSPIVLSLIYDNICTRIY